MNGAYEEAFKAYDIRGVYGETIDEELAERVGAAVVELTGDDRLSIAQDMRPSSEPLAAALASGATRRGADVVRVGLASTDMLYFVSGALDMPGVMLTASHNPAQYNGMKLCRAGAVPIGEQTGLAQLKRMVADGEPVGGAASTGTVQERPDLLDEYARHVLSFVDEKALRPLKVVVDAGNGMAGHVVPPVFERLAFELVPMYFELDGTFPNHPADPIDPQNTVELRERVVAEEADVGLAFDGDADRVFLVDEQGATVASSLVVALVARTMCAREDDPVILHNLICSRVVPETIREAGGTPVRTRVGHSFIKAVMGESGAIFGGEHSGHYYFRDNYRADSGLIAALVALEVLCRADAPLSEVLQPYRRYADSGEVNSKINRPAPEIMKVVAERYPEHDRDWLDGLTVQAEDWWFNLRPSNTEPLLRLNVEAATADRMQQLRDELLATVRALDTSTTTERASTDQSTSD